MVHRSQLRLPGFVTSTLLAGCRGVVDRPLAGVAVVTLLSAVRFHAW